ncbi:leucine efflux protein LeuE [Acinetobacter larvae]|uniref:Leucine efflux protein LeuE n=1 Tax=Acinetobacter larvae TaxID=1789224 RepID=A0A1B2LYH2_9GAMM|nr:leucine efflux protein LeuE [Acinetobacter larvae]AOA57998.1 leucine efflux protein LeuE [Acinetobacter larvae]
MFGISDLLSFIIGTIFIVILPGPNSLYVMSIASKHGVKTGYRGAMGVFCGDSILMLCTVLGAASLLMAFPWLFTAVKIVGAGYLTYIGIRLLIAAYQNLRQRQTQPTTTHSNTPVVQRNLHPFRSALTISLLNPKAILFFLSFFIQFVDPQYPHPALSFAILAIILQCISMTYLSLLIFTGIKLQHYFSRHRKLSGSMVACVGLMFCGFSYKLATASLI